MDQVLSRIDALLVVLKSCKGDTCRAPWAALHPAGDVKSLGEALDERFDGFYDRQIKVQFSRCELGYLLDAEGPQEFTPWNETLEKKASFEYYGHWSEWT